MKKEGDWIFQEMSCKNMNRGLAFSVRSTKDLADTAHIAKNTLMLYFRQILIMLVSLYTVRVVLNTLGAEDYGIYNVVAGVVTMFGFLNSSMAAASQRYFSFSMGQGDYEQLKKTFSTTILIYIIIVGVVLLLAETIGLWFVNNKLIISSERIPIATIVFHFSVLSLLLSIMITPYTALIIAHEDMNVYAYISVIEATLKLIAVILLQFIVSDKLQLYSILMFFLAVSVFIVYFIICRIKYCESKFSLYWDSTLFKEIIRFVSWNLLGWMSGVLKYQAIIILLNQFFNPIVAAARGIAQSVHSAICSFYGNFIVAVRPQIVKMYAADKNDDMFNLMFHCSKGIFLLLFIFILPLILEMPLVLSIWLKNPPENVVLFTRLVLIDALISSNTNPTDMVIGATGKIGVYQIISSGIVMLGFPITWILLSRGFPAYSALIVAIGTTILSYYAGLIILSKLAEFSLIQYFKDVVFPICITIVLSAILPVFIYLSLPQNIFRLCFVIIVSIISVCICTYTVILNKAERKMIKKLIQSNFLSRKGII